MKRISRRRFLGHSLQLASASAAFPALNVLGANGDIRVAVVGFRGHGQTHIRNYLKMPGARVMALCDADRAILDRELDRFKKRGEVVTGYQDIRSLLEREEVDAISTATPNHWHALVTIWACQAGKDVCVEKPVSHNIWEGRQMVAAARKYNRMVQGDLDLRSQPANDEAREYLRSGALGKILVARGFCYKHRPSIGKTQGQGHIPATLDFDLWCGPAEKKPINRNEIHYDWHWVWNTGCGELGNNGPHQLDLIRWLLGEPGLPRRVLSLGGRFGYDDAGETPNTQIALFDYASAPVIYEVRGLASRPGSNAMDTYEALAATGVKLRNQWNGQGPNTGVIIQCEHGYVNADAHAAFDNTGRQIKKFDNSGARDPQSNFIRAVRSRKRADLKTDIEQGHLSTYLCHLGNISYRLGQSAPTEQMREALNGSKDSLEALERFHRHLGVHKIDLQKNAAVLGPWLTLSSTKEQFIGEFSGQANALVKRPGRLPFSIPEQV